MKTAYTIASPCFEDWHTMTPQEGGRYCAVCEKVVVDLSQMAPHKVQSFLDDTRAVTQTESGQALGICVRVRKQKSKPVRGSVLTAGMAAMLAFGGQGCSDTSIPVEGTSDTPKPVEQRTPADNALDNTNEDELIEPYCIEIGEIIVDEPIEIENVKNTSDQIIMGTVAPVKRPIITDTPPQSNQ